MCLGTIYVTISSRNIFIKHFFHDWNFTFQPSANSTEGQNASVLISKVRIRNYYHRGDSASESEHNGIIYVFMLCSAVTLALGILTGWHCKLISCGETSIEWHINKEDARKLKKQGLVFKNPYDFGIWNNWKMFLGLVEGRSWLFILFPSVHPPYGDGLTWPPPPVDVKKDRDRKLHVV